MTKKREVYYCEVCKMVTEVVTEGFGSLVCCGKPMEKLEEKTADVTTEKHVPFIQELENGYLVKVGQNAAHPMTDEHHIGWIELIVDGVVLRKELNPGDAPEALFKVEKGNVVSAREYCNLHGLWKG